MNKLTTLEHVRHSAYVGICDMIKVDLTVSFSHHRLLGGEVTA